MNDLPLRARFLGTPIGTLPLRKEEEALFVSDLHLRPGERAKILAFEHLLGSRPSGSRVFILGDLFDYWVGAPQGRAVGWRELLDLLRVQRERGLDLWVLHGNRDFQLGRAFERRTGVRVQGGGILLERDGEKDLLCLHGDELCLADHRYQRAKKHLRSWPARTLLRALPFALSRRLADHARDRSTKAQSEALYANLLPTKGALQALREEPRLFPCDLLFGHIHRAAQGRIPGEGPTARYHVLPSFEAGGAGHALLRGQELVLVLGGEAAPSFGPALPLP